MTKASRFVGRVSRRSFVTAAAAGACSPRVGAQLTQGAVDATGTNQLRPYLEVKPFPGEEGVVRVFFSPNCAYSRRYLQFFKNLQATLPRNRRFEFTALVDRGDGSCYALAFAAVRIAYPRYVANFVEASLEGAQAHGLLTNTWVGIDAIGRAAHIPASVPALVARLRAEVQVAVAQDIVRQHELKITNTPSVSVSGTYVVTPEFTNGDMSLFSQLVNGIITMSI